ncbi:MAG: DUF2059 domain-containing protein [Xanthobacteraceae bacterium]
MIARLSTRHVVAAFVTLSLLGVAKPVFAQAPAQRPSPAAILIAKQIVEIKGAKELYQPLVRGVIEKVKNQFMQTNFMYAKDLNEIAANLEREYSPRVNELVDTSARIYAGYFTEAELKEILTFYQSPVGRKLIVEEPKALEASMANAGDWGDKLSDEVIAKMRGEMKKRGHDI